MNEKASELERLLLVSFARVSPNSPRAARTDVVEKALAARWDLEFVGPEPGARRGAGSPSTMVAGLKRIHRWVLTDRYELLARRWFRGWSTNARGAVLIGFPFSPLAIAARRLAQQGVPYVLDLGDPWALTTSTPLLRGPALLRARRFEKAMIGGSAGAILTTAEQAHSMAVALPRVPSLVQPNGLSIEDCCMPSADPRPPLGPVLRLAHFGQIHESRITIAPHLEALTGPGGFSGIEVHQYGAVAGIAQLRAASRVRVVVHDPIPWPLAREEVGKYDAALAIGNHNPGQLPSKVVDYSSLPVPRLAFVSDVSSDSIASYLRNGSRPGWLVVSASTPDLIDKVRVHLERRWRPAGELDPSPDQSWGVISDRIVRFVEQRLAPGLRGVSRVGAEGGADAPIVQPDESIQQASADVAPDRS